MKRDPLLGIIPVERGSTLLRPRGPPGPRGLSFLVPTAGIEPASPACETGVLPLNYAGILAFAFSAQFRHFGNLSPKFRQIAAHLDSPNHTMMRPRKNPQRHVTLSTTGFRRRRRFCNRLLVPYVSRPTSRCRSSLYSFTRSPSVPWHARFRWPPLGVSLKRSACLFRRSKHPHSVSRQ